LIEETLLIIRHELNEHDIEVHKNLQPVPPVLADKDQMKQLFLNLILNAMQAMSEGGKLIISTVRDGENINISFQDEGIGIPESVRKKLFEPFFTTKEEGIGLGLSITKRIIEAHNGKIFIESEEGKGSIFHIILPLANSEGT
ncbi:MAG: two-component system sensor histidine kinase NtrB, partial [bacterium]